MAGKSFRETCQGYSLGLSKVIHQKPKDRPRKQRIKAQIKKIVSDYNKQIAIGAYLLLDLFDDGVINLSLVTLLV